MAKIFGTLERASFETLSSNPSAGTLGRFWWNSTDSKAYFDQTSVNRAFLINDGKAILGNSGTAADNIRLHRGASGVLQFVLGSDVTAEGSLSTALNQLSFKHETYTNAGKPANGNAGRVIYVSDLSSLLLDTGSIWTAVGSGGGGGALQWLEDVNAPLPAVENFIRVYKYEATLSQALYASIRVPDSYNVGSQIKLKTMFYSPDASGTALLQSVSTLIRKEVDAVTSTANQRTSTNAAVTLGAGTVNEPQEVSLDLTSSIGEINGIAVGKGDLIIVKLTRGSDTATSDIRAIVYGAEVLLS